MSFGFCFTCHKSHHSGSKAHKKCREIEAEIEAKDWILVERKNHIFVVNRRWFDRMKSLGQAQQDDLKTP